MPTYIKTLKGNGRSPYRDRPWPLPTQRPDGTWEPGEWAESRHVARRRTPLTPAQVDACRPAVYACRPDQLARWVADRAWYIEMDGAVEGTEKVGARRGRLLRPVNGWTNTILRQWACECADRAVRIHAPAALRAAGLTEHADRLAALAPITDRETAIAAWGAADDAYYVAGRESAAAADAVTARAAYDALSAAARAAARAAANAADNAADNAALAAEAAAEAAAADAEWAWQSQRLAELTGIADGFDPDRSRRREALRELSTQADELGDYASDPPRSEVIR